MCSAEIDRLNKRSKELIKSWNQVYIQEVSAFYKEQKAVLEGICENISTFEKQISGSVNPGPQKFASEVLDLHTSNISLLKEIYKDLKTKNEQKEFFNRIRSGIQNEINKLEYKVIDEYPSEILSSEQNSWYNKLLSKAGDYFYNIRITPLKIRNRINKLLKKPEKALKPRTHKVYFRHLLNGFLLKEYASCLQKNTLEIQKRLINYAQNLFELENKLIVSDYRIDEKLNLPEKLFDINEQFKEVEKFYSDFENDFITLLEKSGTCELPFFYIRFKLINKIRRVAFSADAAFRSWDSTFYAFYEDWRFREDLFSFISGVKIQAANTLADYSSKLNNSLIPAISKKRVYLQQLVERIPNPDDADLSSLKHYFSTEIYKLHKEVQSQTIDADLTKTRSEIEKILLKIEVDIAAILGKLSKKSGVVKSPNYEKGIRKSEIYFFSPVEFIEFECLPPFKSKLNAIIKDFSTSFNEIIREFSDFDQISDFTLDTAVSMSNAQNMPAQIIQMSREGMSRSLNILDHITELGNEIFIAKEKELIQIFSNLTVNVQKLDNNDNILSIYSRLLKSKATQATKEKLRKSGGLVSSLASGFVEFIKKQVNVVVNYNKGLRKKLKLDKAAVYVSSEISNYLSEINKRIYKLPVIYRYLFENSPVEEVNLFLSRTKEIDKLNNAFSNWKNGNYAATILIGENGGGRTSLLQNYLSTNKGGFRLSRLSINRFYYSESHFYELMQDVFGNKNLKSEQDVYDELNVASGHQIVVLDGLERVFLRMPGGFDCLHKLLAFIISTNEQAFWICSISLNAYNYLNKTITINENFDYHVELKNLTPEEIKNIVLKRHRLSGYFIQFEDDLKQAENNTKNKNRQTQLEADFFNELNRFAGSNISLSLYYWLESISKFTDKELFIKKFQSPDFSFLETLSAEKIYTLLLIVLHGKMSIDLHAEICDQSLEKSRKVLTILKEDSIVVLKDEYYMLNGILYRHVVQLLKNKNLIH